MNDIPKSEPFLTTGQALRALVEAIEVNVPNTGVFEGQNKMVLWHTRSLGSSERMGISVANNSYEEASLNHIWGLLNQARRVLRLPETARQPDAAPVENLETV